MPLSIIIELLHPDGKHEEVSIPVTDEEVEFLERATMKERMKLVEVLKWKHEKDPKSCKCKYHIHTEGTN